MPRKLAVVAPDTEGQRKPPSTIKQAAESSERDLLVALRAHLAMEMDKGAVPAHALAGVSAKIREYDREVRALDAREEQETENRGPVADEKWSAI
jgi:hypothetical protein